MSEMIKVGMADLKICHSPAAITTLGLGSCVGICLRDPMTKVGGLAHIMLPDSSAFRTIEKVAKFADTGIDELVRLLEQNGASGRRLEAKIAGGAMMFAYNSTSATMRVGEKNVEATLKKLKELGIPVLAQDTGETFGRTIIYYPETGELKVRAVGKSEKTI